MLYLHQQPFLLHMDLEYHSLIPMSIRISAIKVHNDNYYYYLFNLSICYDALSTAYLPLLELISDSVSVHTLSWSTLEVALSKRNHIQTEIISCRQTNAKTHLQWFTQMVSSTSTWTGMHHLCHYMTLVGMVRCLLSQNSITVNSKGIFVIGKM